MKKPHQETTAPKVPALKVVGPSWQIQTAKARFSEVFRLARTQGPQLITHHNKESVVMVSLEQFDQLAARAHQPKSLVQFFRESPLVAVELDLERSQDTGPDIQL